MARIAKHIREAIKEAGVRPESIFMTRRSHYCVVINGTKVFMANSPSDGRAMKNAIATMKAAAKERS